MKKNLAVILIIIAVLVVGVGIGVLNGKSHRNSNEVKSANVSVKEISYRGAAGQTALELLQLQYQIQVKEYSFGTMVTGINGLSADKSHFWALYVNGKLAETGADSYITEEGDNLTWKYENIK